MEPFIETWTGGTICPLDPWPEDIDIRDIAHGLSYKPRYSGLGRYYTISEHSVHLAKWCLQNGFGKTAALHALLHDSTEAYLPDVASPIKPAFPEFKEYENRLLQVIYQAFCLVPPDSTTQQLIKHMDMRIIVNERPVVLPNHRAEVEWGVFERMEPLPGVKIYCWGPDRSESEFTSMWNQLY